MTSTLDEPALQLENERGQVKLGRILMTASTFGGGEYTQLVTKFAEGRQQYGGSARNVLDKMGVTGRMLDGALDSELTVLEARDAAIADVRRHATKCLDAPPPAPVTDPGSFARFTKARRLSAAYQDSTGEQHFAEDDRLYTLSERDLLHELTTARDAEIARRLTRESEQKIVLAAERADASPSARVKQLQQFKSEGVRELDAALGNTRQLDVPQGGPGNDLDMTLRVLDLLQSRGYHDLSGANFESAKRELDAIDAANADAPKRYGPLYPVN